jgi:hypothetical protein
LHQQIGGACEIALGLAIARPFEATVGDQVARRQMDWLKLQRLKPLFFVSSWPRRF